jgi:hypothetical protein
MHRVEKDLTVGRVIFEEQLDLDLGKILQGKFFFAVHMKKSAPCI